MEKDIGKIRKNDNTDIVIRIDDFGGRVGLTIREFTNSDRYTGFTKSGTRIPIESFSEFREMINSIDEQEISQMQSQTASQPSQTSFKKPISEKVQKKLIDRSSEGAEEQEENSESESEEIEEEVF